MVVVPVKLFDGTILMHGKTPYDPVKAHEYYVRTRQLKGREKGRSSPVGRSSISRSPTFTVKTSRGKVRLTGQQLAEQRAYAAKRVNNIKNRLSELNVKLRKAMAAAETKKDKIKREAKKAPTATEKSKAARESEKYREKHKTKLATKRKATSGKTSAKSKSEPDPVAALEHKIDQVKTRLTAAVAKQRALASATRNS
jgi:hypothetical protein